MRTELHNGALNVSIDSHGAELRSLTKDGREYMWSGDKTYWGRVSPILFPLVGSLKGKAYLDRGLVYPMGQHGFARDMEFSLVFRDETCAVFALESSDETLEKFPYAFYLEVSYRLTEDALEVGWKVENPGKENLHFSIGAHPAFLCQMGQDSFRIYEEVPGIGDLVAANGLVCGILGADGTLSDKTVGLELEEGELPITQELFEEDALIVENPFVKRVALADARGKEYLKVDFDTPLFGLWSPAGKKAPFVCIEPWYGRCDAKDYNGEWKDREYGNTLAPGETFETRYSITV